MKIKDLVLEVACFFTGGRILECFTNNRILIGLGGAIGWFMARRLNENDKKKNEDPSKPEPIQLEELNSNETTKSEMDNPFKHTNNYISEKNNKQTIQIN